MSTQTQFLKEWTGADFSNIESAIASYFSFSPINSSHGNYKASTKSYEEIDMLLGLAFTSSSKCAMLSICNIQAQYNKEYHYEYFVIGVDGEFYAICWDLEEKEIIINIKPFTCKEDVLKCCTVKDHIVSLPPQQLTRDLYNDVKQSLNLIGGIWKSGKVQGFEFKENPSDLLQQIANGEKRNLKKEFQFFGTPVKLADKLVELAGIEEGMSVLEPEAGQGAIIAAIYKAFPYFMQGPNDKQSVTVDYYEFMPVNNEILSRRINSNVRWSSSTSFWGEDFLQADPTRKYDRVIANPPFNKNQDIDHIYKMYECCKDGGRIVSVASKHWQRSTNKKEVAFKNWLDEINAEIIEVEAGEFKESGTTIATCIIIINK